MYEGTSFKWHQRLFGLWIDSSGLQIWLGIEQGWTIFVEYHRRSLPWFYVHAMIYSQPSLTVECNCKCHREWAWRSFFTVQVSLLCKRILSTHALKKSSLVFLEIFDSQIMCSLLQAFQWILWWSIITTHTFWLVMCPEDSFHRLNHVVGVCLFQKNHLYPAGMASTLKL